MSGRVGGVTAKTNGAAIHSGLDLSHVDAQARPQDDLFGHVNGRWLTDYVIPADRATDGAFRSLFDRAEEQVRDLIAEAASAGAADGTDPQRIGDLYASFMDEETVQRRGVQPLLDELALIDGAGDADALAAVLGALQRTGVGGGAGLYVDTDSKDSSRYLVHVNQSGIGLPDESYYRDPQHAEILAAYPGHIARMFALVHGGTPEEHAHDRRPHRRAGNRTGRGTLGCGQAPRRRPDLQPARIHRPGHRGAGVRLDRMDHRAR